MYCVAHVPHATQYIDTICFLVSSRFDAREFVRPVSVTQNGDFAPAEVGLSLSLSLSSSFGARRLRGHAGACRRLPLFFELSGGGGASRPRKVVHYLQPCNHTGMITRLCAWRRSRTLCHFLPSRL